MARDRGVYNMSGNIELSKEAPLDARRKVNTFAELFLEATWKDSNNKVWLYDGMTVEVGDRLGELWQLKSKTSYSRQEDWVKISGGIEEAPKDGNPYMRKNGAWNAYTQIEEVYTFVADINGNKISQDAYNGLKAAVKAGKVIAIKLVDVDNRWIVSLSSLSGDTINLIAYVGDAFQTIVIKSDLSVTETNKNFILRDNTAQYEVTGDYNPAHKKYVDTVTNNIKNNVLLKNNTTSYTPTQDYHPSTKQYVDNSVKSVQNNVILKNNNTPYNPTNDYNPATKKYVDDTVKGNKELAVEFDYYAVDGLTSESTATEIKAAFEANAAKVKHNCKIRLTGINDSSDFMDTSNGTIDCYYVAVVDADNTPSFSFSYFDRNGNNTYICVSSTLDAVEVVKYNLSDNTGYGKVIIVSDISKFLYNVNLIGADAEQRIIDLFGSVNEFKAVVIDVLTNHTRYYFHINNNLNNNCIELGCVNAWRANDSTSYELHFIITYFGSNPIKMFTNRISIVSNDDNRKSKVIIASLVNSDNINTLTKKTSDEYNNIASKDNETMYAITDA